MLAGLVCYMRDHRWQLFRFVIVGIITLVINISAVWLFHDAFSYGYKVSVSLAYVIAVFVHYNMNRVFTYRHVGSLVGTHSLKYIIMLLVNYLITMFITIVTVEALSKSAYHGVVFSVFFTAISSFLLMKHFVFYKRIY